MRALELARRDVRVRTDVAVEAAARRRAELTVVVDEPRHVPFAVLRHCVGVQPLEPRGRT